MIGTGAKVPSSGIRDLSYASLTRSLSNKNSALFKTKKPGGGYSSVAVTPLPVAMGAVAGAPFASPQEGGCVSASLGLNNGCSARFLYPWTGSPFRCWTFLSCFSITWTESSTWCNPDFEAPQPILVLELVLRKKWNLKKLVACLLLSSSLWQQSSPAQRHFTPFYIDQYMISFANRNLVVIFASSKTEQEWKRERCQAIELRDRCSRKRRKKEQVRNVQTRQRQGSLL